MKAVASINSGSSSIKFALFGVSHESAPELLARGLIDGIGTAPRMKLCSPRGPIADIPNWPGGGSLSHEALLSDLFAWTAAHVPKGIELIGIGHRVVHGGAAFGTPVLVDDMMMAKLEALSPLAPLHQPHNLAAIRALAALACQVPQVACFDTAFHRTMPEAAARIPIPRAFHDQGIRRYGFHGLSYEHVARRLAEIDPALSAGRVIAAHLGNGASLCAMRGGRSIDTTMGFSPLDGLMMGTRPGSIDPGVLLHLQLRLGLPATELEDLLYHRSGLLGVSEISSDMRQLEASAAPHAAEALELFAWRAAREMGGLAASLGGLDGVVFTAGVGEHDAAMRERICARLAFLGVALDDSANRANAARISTADSRVAVLVIPADEERMIALHTIELLCQIAPAAVPNPNLQPQRIGRLAVSTLAPVDARVDCGESGPREPQPR